MLPVMRQRDKTRNSKRKLWECKQVLRCVYLCSPLQYSSNYKVHSSKSSVSRVGYDRRFSISQWTTLLIIVQVFQPQPMLSGAYNPAHSHEIFIDPFRVGCQIPEKTQSKILWKVFPEERWLLQPRRGVQILIYSLGFRMGCLIVRCM